MGFISTLPSQVRRYSETIIRPCELNVVVCEPSFNLYYILWNLFLTQALLKKRWCPDAGFLAALNSCTCFAPVMERKHLPAACCPMSAVSTSSWWTHVSCWWSIQGHQLGAISLYGMDRCIHMPGYPTECQCFLYSRVVRWNYYSVAFNGSTVHHAIDRWMCSTDGMTADWVQRKFSGENASQCHYVDNKNQMGYAGENQGYRG